MRRACVGLSLLLTACASGDGLRLLPAAAAEAPVRWTQLKLEAGESAGTFRLKALKDGQEVAVASPAPDSEPSEFRLADLVPAAAPDLVTDLVEAVAGEEPASRSQSPFLPGGTYAWRYEVDYEHKGQSPATVVLELSTETTPSATDDIIATSPWTAVASKSFALTLKPCSGTPESSCSIGGVFWFSLADDVNEAPPTSARLNLRLRTAAGKVMQGSPTKAFPVRSAEEAALTPASEAPEPTPTPTPES
ncbi:MAG: hypothetical protein VKO21_11185 [Candidatus Sericytochromatia bacterium]|nr:hypothetical protein [Candidatus Sericytochromatia bacterium]